MATQLELGGIPVEVLRKDIKHVHLTVHPPTGRVRISAPTIRLNTELAKKPPVCLEYLVAHEMIHLIEPTHGPRFVDLMDRFMPKWRHYWDELNRLPVRHEDWIY